MKRTSILLVLCLLIITLSACDSMSDHNDVDISDANSVSNSTHNDADATDESGLSAVDSISGIPSPNSILETDDIFEQIIHGDFSNVDFGGAEHIKEIMERSYDRDGMEWVECDLNETGLKGLLWQEKKSEYHHRKIQAIFALSNDQAHYVYFDYVDKDYCFLGKNGNIIHRYWMYGTADWNTVTHYTWDDEINRIKPISLTITSIDDWYEEQVREELLEIWDDDEGRERLLRQWGSNAKSLEEFIESYPEERIMTGEYYKRIDRTGEDEVEETLTKQQFLDAFEEMTGLSFYEMNAEGYYMRDDMEARQAQAEREAEEMGR